MEFNYKIKTCLDFRGFLSKVISYEEYHQFNRFTPYSTQMRFPKNLPEKHMFWEIPSRLYLADRTNDFAYKYTFQQSPLGACRSIPSTLCSISFLSKHVLARNKLAVKTPPSPTNSNIIPCLMGFQGDPSWFRVVIKHDL